MKKTPVLGDPQGGNRLTRLLRTADVANGFPPSYARSTPPTYLESAAPPQERRRQRGKDEDNDTLEHCEPSANRKES
jgi:hypothetical protein